MPCIMKTAPSATSLAAMAREGWIMSHALAIKCFGLGGIYNTFDCRPLIRIKHIALPNCRGAGKCRQVHGIFAEQYHLCRGGKQMLNK